MTATAPWTTEKPTALLVLADGTVIEGKGIGATGKVQAEVVFNTALTGYEEILTDPSYLGQIVTFTFPHIGNIGTNDEDIEDLTPAARHGAVGVIFKADITEPSNYRAAKHLDAWLKSRGVIGLCGIDTRALTAWIRENGAPNAVIAHDPNGVFDLETLKAEAKAWSGLEGLDLAKIASSGQSSQWAQTPWIWNEGYAELGADKAKYHVVCLDYGVKRNILRLFAGLDCKVTVVPATTSAEDVLAMQPDGIFLSNGPGDPAATGEYAVPVIRKLIKTDIPVFGICLGHQMLGLALGAKTEKMHQGHHGANHPVKDHTTGKVEIVSMNHGFAVDTKSLPEGVEETHVSLFDGTNCGLRVAGKQIFSVQHHPEASPGPQDSHYLFRRFINMVRGKKGEAALAER
ncbi:glutamine-hydrolyzing carbamoyl-phosphate synthase small subunit [Rhizobium sp. 007]|uniref:glutamine-hydrolyzing carbamoyl-phosphate synthase small subunit n=1 Tax=Rhizobium sp. 007 TaxID=2785056 RepID=UPI001890030B|nr:glutamine-hydrolyzing carbamoyl-phosphate synthase small subunit [Rhizobium sp. 007]QPB22019.1 glutamine-hydrolyzing carbamoyl-phosphate synthase small subunit [Rhizobium sp. 007]